MVAQVLNPNFGKFLAAGTIGVAAILGLPGVVHAARPNIIVIQTDDQTLDQLYAAIEPEGVPIARKVRPRIVRS